MARARNIKPGFFRNAELVELPIETRLLFPGLWILADREGRLEDRPKQIKMEIFPADSFDVDAMLQQLHNANLIIRYEVDGKRYIQVTNFSKHQNPHRDERASSIPAPTGHDASTVQAPCKHSANTMGIGLIPDSLIPDSLNLIPESTTLAPDKPDADIKPAKTARRACQLPADFYPNKTGVEYADARSISFATELESFRNWHSAKGTTMKDWQAAWRTWCDKAVTYGRTSAGPPARASPAQARYEAGMEVVDVLTGRGKSSGRERVITGEVIGITRAVGG